MNRQPVVGDLICYKEPRRNYSVQRVVDVTATHVVCVTVSNVSGGTRKFYKNPKVTHAIPHEQVRDNYTDDVILIAQAERQHITEGWAKLGFSV